MKKYSLHMQLPNGDWVRISNQAYLLPSAQKVWKEVLLDAYRIGWPKRELRPVEDKVSEADLNETDKAPFMGLVRGEGRTPAKGGGETTNRVSVGGTTRTREVRVVPALQQTTLVRE